MSLESKNEPAILSYFKRSKEGRSFGSDLDVVQEFVDRYQITRRDGRTEGLKKLLAELGECASNFEADRVLGGWSQAVYIGDELIVNATIAAAAGVFRKRRLSPEDDEVKGYIAAKATAMLLSADGPRPGGAVTYGREAYNKLIRPVVREGRTLGVHGMTVFAIAESTDYVSTHPLNACRGIVGFRNLL